MALIIADARVARVKQAAEVYRVITQQGMSYAGRSIIAVRTIRRQLRVPRLETGVPFGLRQRIALSTGCCSTQGGAQ
jgi:hypothetical protein